MGQHWYDINGKPCHFQVKEKGGQRATTLRDARKLQLFPSVTGILNIANKESLNRWRVEQAYLACLTLPRIDNEPLDAFKKRAVVDANKQVESAKDLGGEIHDSIEHYFKGHRKVKHLKAAEAVFKFVTQHTGLTDGWLAEKTFSSKEGYAGMVDLHHVTGSWVIDYKTKDFKDASKKMAYDENCMQLSAYAKGLGFPNARKMNIFVSREVPGLITHHEWDEDMYDRFECLLKYWQLTKRYRPCID